MCRKSSMQSMQPLILYTCTKNKGKFANSKINSVNGYMFKTSLVYYILGNTKLHMRTLVFFTLILVMHFLL